MTFQEGNVISLSYQRLFINLCKLALGGKENAGTHGPADALIRAVYSQSGLWFESLALIRFSSCVTAVHCVHLAARASELQMSHHDMTLTKEELAAPCN